MATVAIVAGVAIRFHWNEHPPPHFHAELADDTAVIDIRDLKLIRGSLPGSKLREVVKWASTRKAALQEAWSATAEKRKPGKIK
jgi:hypothetical protein